MLALTAKRRLLHSATKVLYKITAATQRHMGQQPQPMVKEYSVGGGGLGNQCIITSHDVSVRSVADIPPHDKEYSNPSVILQLQQRLTLPGPAQTGKLLC